MKMSEVAQKLDLHESTISRTVREKYLQCSQGVFPMRYFFSRNASTYDTAHREVGVVAAHALLRRLVDQENKAHPMSDQSLCESMAALGCPYFSAHRLKISGRAEYPERFWPKAALILLSLETLT